MATTVRRRGDAIERESAILPGFAKRPGRSTWVRLLRPYGLILPLVAWWGLIIAYPLVRAVLISFTNSSPLNPTVRFVGPANFAQIFAGGATREAVLFTIVFAVVSTALELTAGTILALLLSRLRRFRWLRGVMMVPWALSEIVVATAGAWFFNSRFGLVDAIFHTALGIRPVWLGDVTLARLAVILMNSWEFTPLVGLFILTALLNVPSELVEQAKVDGASEARTYQYVHWNMIQPIFFGVATFVTAVNIVAFALPYAMTGGGPGTSTSLASYQVYELAIPGLQYASGAALGIVILAMVLITAAIGGTLMRRAERRLS